MDGLEIFSNKKRPERFFRTTGDKAERKDNPVENRTYGLWSPYTNSI